MSDKNTKNKGSTLKWLIGILISLVAAGGGIVKLLEYRDSQQDQEIEIGKQKEAADQEKIFEWENFSPASLANGTQIVELRGGSYLNLENGHISDMHELQKSDLLFSKGGGVYGHEYLRALNKAAWSDIGVVNFEDIKYREIRDARYSSPKNNKSGYPDLFYAYGSGVPRVGYVFFIKTIEGNVAKIRIQDYKSFNNNPAVVRNIVFKYEVFPIVNDPPRP